MFLYEYFHVTMLSKGFNYNEICTENYFHSKLAMKRDVGAVTMFAILVRSGAFLLVPRKLKTAAFMKHHCRFMTVDNNDRKSVSGIVYEASTADSPTIRLFTKVGCTLCDKVKDVRII